MQAGRWRSRLTVATLAAAAASLVVGPVAAARTKIPERPKAAAAKRVTPQGLGRGGDVVIVGYDSYSGLELFVTRAGGRIVGIPYG